MSRQPTKDDFPSSMTVDIVLPVGKDLPTNVLVLLHGLGGSQASFSDLGARMKFPETTCVALRAPHPLLDIPDAFHWGDDVVFNSSDGSVDSDAGFKASLTLMRVVVNDILVARCGFERRAIMVFGFGQGAMLALHFAASEFESSSSSSSTSSSSPSSRELGGVISIGAGLPGEAPASLQPKCSTPVLVCAGALDSSVTPTSEDKLKRVFEFVEVNRYAKSGDHMPSNQAEMFPIMKFFARRLRSVKGVPAGSVEIR